MGPSDKLHLGCGNEILDGWLNHDIVQLPGVDVVHDLETTPWPFGENTFREIRLFHVLEHLPNTVKTMEELHRICAPDARVCLRVPFWNSPDMITDPTHKVFFNEHTFDYFDPATRHGRERPYYSKARFHIGKIHYWTNFRRYRKVSNPVLQRPLRFLSRHLCGIIWVLEVELRAIK